MGQPQGGGTDSVAVAVAGGVALAALVIGFVASVLFWFAGQLSGLLFHGTWPDAPPNESIRIFVGLFSNLGDPSAAWPEAARDDVGPAIVIYILFLIFVAPIGWGIAHAVQYAVRFRRRRENRTFRLGFADGGEVRKLLSGQAVAKKAKSVRPSYKGKKNINPLDVGFYLGRDVRSRRKLYCSVEDVMLVVAPPRQGKDVHFCIPNIIDAPGPCVATTTRADMFAATVSLREKFGKIQVFDPNGMTNWPDQLRWSPVNGCEDPLVALNRAAAFVAGAGVGEGVQNASYWTGVATAIMRCYFLAAATSGRTITDVVRWSTQPTNPEPIQILRKMESLGRAPQGWAGELESGASADGETRGNMWAGVRRALDCFADPNVLATCSPGPDDIFDVADFCSGRNTLYVLGKEKKNGSVAPLVTAMMEDIFDQVRKIASRMPNSRIDPPLTVELNEVAHIAPMPNLPGYMGDSGGFSIALHIYLQSLGQARSKWGNDEAAIMWDTAAIRVVMGGSGYVNDLEDISRLMGEVDEKTKSISKGAGGTSTSYSKQKRRVLTLDELRTLEFGTAVVIARAARPVESRLTPYWKRKDAAEISAGQARVAKIIAEADEKAKLKAGVLASPLAASGGALGAPPPFEGDNAAGGGGFGGGGAFGGGLHGGPPHGGVTGGSSNTGGYSIPVAPVSAVSAAAGWASTAPAQPPRSWGGPEVSSPAAPPVIPPPPVTPNPPAPPAPQNPVSPLAGSPQATSSMFQPAQHYGAGEPRYGEGPGGQSYGAALPTSYGGAPSGVSQTGGYEAAPPSHYGGGTPASYGSSPYGDPQGNTGYGNAGSGSYGGPPPGQYAQPNAGYGGGGYGGDGYGNVGTGQGGNPGHASAAYGTGQYPDAGAVSYRQADSQGYQTPPARQPYSDSYQPEAAPPQQYPPAVPSPGPPVRQDGWGATAPAQAPAGYPAEPAAEEQPKTPRLASGWGMPARRTDQE